MADDSAPAGATLLITDRRTGTQKEIQVDNETKSLRAMEFRALKTNPSDFGLLVHDNGYRFTACCRSSVSFVDAEKGKLYYRGYPIEDLAEKSSFLEVAFLLIHGDLPSGSVLEKWEDEILHHTYLHENLVQLLDTFRYDSHPMGILISTISALSTFYPEANPGLRQQPGLYQEDIKLRTKQIYRILGKLPTIAAYVYLHRIGRPMCAPGHDMGYVENLLYMIDRLSDDSYRPNPLLVKVLDKLFILQADHELNNSTATMRQIGSSLADPYTAIASAAGSLYGPHGGAPNDNLIKMLEEIKEEKNIDEFLELAKQKKKTLWGFGSPIYKKSTDPRVPICESLCQEVVSSFGERPLVSLALKLVQKVQQNEYFLKRNVTPNINFYTTLIYYSIGFPVDMYPVLFAIPRAVGWLAHWIEGISEKGARIYRPRQIFNGPPPRSLPASRAPLLVDHRQCAVSGLDVRIRMSFGGEEEEDKERRREEVQPLLRGSSVVYTNK